LNEIHEIPRRLTICLGLKYDVQIRGRSEHMEQGPESEPFATISRQTEVDFHAFDAGVQSFRWNCC
jgi:hypothetical protein